jgi:hypothetical protein
MATAVTRTRLTLTLYAHWLCCWAFRPVTKKEWTKIFWPWGRNVWVKKYKWGCSRTELFGGCWSGQPSAYCVRRRPVMAVSVLYWWALASCVIWWPCCDVCAENVMRLICWVTNNVMRLICWVTNNLGQQLLHRIVIAVRHGSYQHTMLLHCYSSALVYNKWHYVSIYVRLNLRSLTLNPRRRKELFLSKRWESLTQQHPVTCHNTRPHEIKPIFQIHLLDLC